MTQPSAFDVRQAVSELCAEAAPYAVGDGDSLGKRFVRIAKKHWSRRAMTDSTGSTLTYGQTLIASQLLAGRIRRTDNEEKMIGVMLPASAAAALVNLGIVLAGRVPVNLNFTVGRGTMDSAVEQCGLRTIISSRQFLVKSKIEKRPEMILGKTSCYSED
jgi:acyl-[acyl-carrier-protein]-phospholipid O-acyltransferase/long-chain-fatty-acid--[acyl-carrier-protein] ligase